MLLAIDTSGPRLQIALLADDALFQHVEHLGTGHAEKLFSAIDSLLAQADVDFADLTRIAVTTGPGSFTGIRVGLSAARGLGLSLDIPVIGIPSLLAMSLTTKVEHPFRIVVDARRGEAYVQDFSKAGHQVSDAALVPIESAGNLEPHHLIIENPDIDIAALARFAAEAKPADFPANPAYLRAADAKPQQKARIELQPGALS